MFFIKWPSYRLVQLPLGQRVQFQRTYFLGSASNGDVVFVQHDTHFFHKSDLFFVVAIEFGAGNGMGKGGVNFRKQVVNVLSRDDLSLGGS